MSLQQELDRLKLSAKQKMPANVFRTIESVIEELEASGIEHKSLKEGDAIPPFSLTDTHGHTVSSEDLLAGGTVVINFYRGGWCPFCVTELAALSRNLSELEQLGASLVAITPELPDRASDTQLHNDSSFKILHDHNLEVARSFGLVFPVTDRLLSVYQNAFQLDLSEINGTETYELPMPATYVIGRDGVIQFAFAKIDHTTRAEPEEILDLIYQGASFSDREENQYLKMRLQHIREDSNRLETELTDLRYEQARSNQIIKMMPDVALSFNWDGHILMANEAAARVADVPVEEVLGKNIQDLRDLTQHNATVFERARQAMVRGESEFVPEEKIRDGKGNIRTFQMHWIPYTDVYTDKKAVLEVATDISEIKRMEFELLEKRRLERDLEIARDIQVGLLPREQINIHGFDIAGWNQPADETGGDFFDWFELPDGRFMVSIADVTGHGIGPALVASICRAYLRAVSHADVSVTTLLNTVNALLSEDIPDGRFVTAATGILNGENHVMTFLSAGHGPILFYRASDKTTQSCNADAIPLGLDDELKFGPAREYHFDVGDVLVLITDGFFEWPNEEGEEYGIERLQETIQSSAHLSANEMISTLYESVRAFVGNMKQADDLTAVIVKRSES